MCTKSRNNNNKNETNTKYMKQLNQMKWHNDPNEMENLKSNFHFCGDYLLSRSSFISSEKSPSHNAIMENKRTNERTKKKKS